MRLMKINLYHLSLPFRMSFGHAQAKHNESNNIVVSCQLEDGTIGYGESVPREYVTGESIDSVFDLFEKTRRCHFQKNIVSASELVAHLSQGWCEAHESDCASQAARCATELALLDAYGKFFYTSVEDLLSGFGRKKATSSKNHVSGVIGESGLLKQKFRASMMKLYRLPAIKLKVGADKKKVLRSVKAARRTLGKKYDFRIDANGAWSYSEALDILQSLEPYKLSAVEEPLKREDKIRLADLRKETKVPIILDESFCSKQDLELAIREKCADGINIRISKCGGLIRSLEMAQQASENGLMIQLGSHVGEDGILASAARHFLRLFPDVRFLETSYGPFLLKHSIVSEKLGFGYGGRLKGRLKPVGLGINVREDVLERYSKRRFEILLI